MISEDRVKTEFKLAMLEAGKEKEMDTARGFWEFDYIGKELLVSFVTGTLCYLLLIVLWVFSQMEELIEQINATTLDYGNLGLKIGVWYLAFMLIYFMITILVYAVRYRSCRKAMNQYSAGIRRMGKIYAWEDKTK